MQQDAERTSWTLINLYQSNSPTTKFICLLLSARLKEIFKYQLASSLKNCERFKPSNISHSACQRNQQTWRSVLSICFANRSSLASELVGVRLYSSQILLEPSSESKKDKTHVVWLRRLARHRSVHSLNHGLGNLFR